MGIEQVFDPAAEAEELAPPVEPPEPEPAPEPPQEPEPAAAIETPPTPEPPAAVEHDKTVPLAALLDIRDERNELKRRLAELEAQAPKPASQPKADPYDDPEGFRAEFQRELQQQRVQDRLDFSYQLASDKHGAEKVEEARNWALERAQTDPGFGVALDAQKHPMEWIVQQHAKSQDLSAYETDPIAFAKAILEKHGALGTVTAQAPAVVVEQQQAPEPPKSLASSPSKGGLTREPTQSALGAVFGR